MVGRYYENLDGRKGKEKGGGEEKKGRRGKKGGWNARNM
jgi:hypothetical protein